MAPTTPVETSVVVASFSGAASLGRCLESLAPQIGRCEVIVASRADRASLGLLCARHPECRFLAPAPGAGVFELRSIGLRAASGRFAVLIEDHCTVRGGWLDALRDACREGHAAVGGPVENGLAGIYRRALYLAEYAAHMPPLPVGPARALTGVNVAYQMEALHRCREVWREVFYENEVHDALARLGHALHSTPRAVVVSHLELSPSVALAHLFRGGRRFGSYRAARLRPTARLALRFAALAVPPLLTLRILRTLARRQPRQLPRALAALPFVACFVSAWAAGESLGYALPPPSERLSG